MRTRFWKELTTKTCPKTIIIFICTTDPFKLGLPKYTFKTTCAESDMLNLDDNAKKIIYNASNYEGIEDKDLKAKEKSVASFYVFPRSGKWEPCAQVKTWRARSACDMSLRRLRHNRWGRRWTWCWQNWKKNKVLPKSYICGHTLEGNWLRRPVQDNHNLHLHHGTVQPLTSEIYIQNHMRRIRHVQFWWQRRKN